MSKYEAPVRDMRFVLFDVLGVEPIYQRLGYEAATRDVIDAVLDEAARFTETVLAPLNKVGDEVGCKYDAASGDVVVSGANRTAAQKIYVRGIEETSLNVSIDGARQGGNLYSHSGDNSNIDPFLLKQVTVEPGTGSALTGPGALGGAIAGT